MIYKSLCLEYGGGIIDHHNLIDQTDSAVLYIGIGGTGINCLKQLRKEVYNRVKPKDDIMMQEYQRIQFLGIDSDYSSFEGLNKEDEYIHLEGDIGWWIAHEKFRKSIKQLNWMNDNLSIYEPGQPKPLNCTYGVRQNGRLLTFLNIHKIESILTDKIRLAIEDTNQSKLYIHIMTSVCGGTGSGSVLDICYILKHIIHKLSIGARTRICGFFILPDVLYSKISSKQTKAFLEVNSFAFFKELDYCMNFGLNGGKWEQDYFSFIVKSKLPPVDNAFILGGNGETKQDTFNKIINFLLNSLTNEASVYERLYCRDPILELDHQYSCNQLLCKKYGAGYRYFRLSGVKAVVPYIEINTYIASKLFQDFSFDCPTDEDLNDFICCTALTYDELLYELMNKTINVPNFDVDTDTLFDQIEDLVIDDEYEIPCPKSLIRMKDSYTRIAGEIDSELDFKISNVFERIQNEFENRVVSCAKHPEFVVSLIKNQEYGKLDLIKVFDNYLLKNINKVADAYKALAIIRRKVVHYFDLMQKSRKSRNTNAKMYIDAMHDYYTELVKIKVFDEMNHFLSEIKDKLSELYDEFWIPLSCITKNLLETLSNNLAYLENKPINNSRFTIELFSINNNNVRDCIDELINDINRKQLYADYSRFMIDNFDKWSSYHAKNPKNKMLDELFKAYPTKVVENTPKWAAMNQEEIIKQLINEFFTNRLFNICNVTIDQFFGLKYNNCSEEELYEIIYQDLFKDMLQGSDESLFISDILSSSDLSIMKSYTINVPSISMALKAASDKLCHNNQGVTVREVLARDVVYLNELIFCVPLFAIDTINRYRQEYDLRCDLRGIHLYE